MELEKFMESYKPLMAIPIIITIIAVALLAFNGLNQGIDLKGGTIADLQLQKPIDQAQLDALISNGLGINEVDIKSIDASKATVEMGESVDVIQFSGVINGTATLQSFRTVGPVLSAAALTQIYWALAIAFLFMSITVFIIFRNLVPSLAVIMAALSNILIALGGMSLFGIPISMASVGALLLLIGYSVDTDILLTTRVLKRKEGTVTNRAIDAMKTGLTMSGTAIGAMAALYIVTVFFIPSAQTLADIAAVLIIGLVADILATWFLNLGILRWYLERGRR